MHITSYIYMYQHKKKRVKVGYQWFMADMAGQGLLVTVLGHIHKDTY